MSNKEMIKKFKDYAELAWVAYGYYDLIEINNPKDVKEKNLLNKFKKQYAKLNDLNVEDTLVQEKQITLADILNINYQSIFKGDFSSTQAKNFFEKYELLIHQPNTSSGFSATLFQDKESKEFILAFRGTEFPSDISDVKADASLFAGNVPTYQYQDMLLFYYQCIGKLPFCIPKNTPLQKESLEFEISKNYESSKAYINPSLLRNPNESPTKDNFIPPINDKTLLNIVGHSLGGALAQLFALSFADDKQRGIINEVYTFNSPGAKDLKLYDTIIYIPNIPNDTMKEFLSQSFIKTLNQKAQELYLNTQDNDLNQKLEEMLNNTANNTYLGINFYFHNDEKGTLTFAYEKVPYDFLTAYQTLIYNYNNKDKDNYRLSISDKVFHIESKNQADDNYHAKESYPRNATQHLGKDIEGNYFSINLNFEGINSHKIVEITKVLYFYEYLYEMNESLIDEQSKKVQLEYEKDISKENKEDDTPKKFFKKHSEIDTKEYKESKKALEYCNLIALSIHKILYNIELAKVEKEGTLDDNSCIPPPPNWLYAMIDRVAFEATLLTKQNKFLVKKDRSNIIEAILYLQENKVYIQILEEETIKNIKEESPLSYLFAIFEYLFFISVDENKNPLVEDKQISCSLLGYKTPKIKIFCSSPDELLIQCYKNETLRFYPLLKMAQ